MASISFMYCFIVIFIVFRKVHPAPHFTAGELNTLVSDSSKSTEKHIMIKSGISTMISNFVNTRQDNAGHESYSRDARNNVSADVIENLSASNVDVTSELQPLPVSRVDQINPFFRSKRQACVIPPEHVHNITELYSLLNDTVFLGRYNLTQTLRPIIPTGQPQACPNRTEDQWPGTHPNLRSTCPWNIIEHDLGEDAFPRYIPEANCLCGKCMRRPLCLCQKLRKKVIYFIREPFQGVLPLMTMKTKYISIGCYCECSTNQNAAAT